MNRVLLFAVCWATALPASAADGPEQNVGRLERACSTGELEVAQAQFTSGCWKRKWDSGENFCGQVGRKRFKLVVSESKEAGQRAVVTVDVYTGGRPVDQVYLYFVRQRGRWLIASLDENRHFQLYFLSGRLGPDFRARDLPSNSELDKLGELLLKASLDSGEVRKRARASVSGPNLEEQLDKIARLSGARFMASHYSDTLDCGALAYEGDSRSPGRTEKLFLILTRGDPRKKFRLSDASYSMLFNRSFLWRCHPEERDK